MNVLVDTNILISSAQPGHIHYQLAVDAVATLRLSGHLPCLVPQVIYEYWVVASRPRAVNGLGMTTALVAAEVNQLCNAFTLLPDNASIFTEWQRLVTTHQVVGKNAHDARLVAAMLVHGLTNLLTFNTQDFVRYPAVTALDPAAIPPPAP